MLYQFTDDWIVDHHRYAALLGDHATSLDNALVATVASHRPAADCPVTGERLRARRWGDRWR